MRGHRSRLDVKDGEVDEHFWAQAAADQAAGTSMEDESKHIKHALVVTLLTPTNQVKVERFLSTLNFSTTITMMDLGLMISMMGMGMEQCLRLMA